MSSSPAEKSSEVLKITLSIDGSDVTDTVNIVSVFVNKAVNRIPRARITLLDGDMPKKEFLISDKDDFIPGKKIVISAGYGSEASQIFAGIIIKQGIDITPSNESTLVIDCKDAAIKMTAGRKNANFIKQTASAQAIKDKTVMTGLIGAYSDLSADVDDTTAELSGIVQYNVTDWDFLVSRAEANAMLVMVSDAKVSIKKPDLTASASMTVTYGEDLFSFKAELDSSYQYKKVTGVAWDLSTLAIIEEPVSATSDSSTRGSKNGDLSSVIGLDNYTLQSQTPLVKQTLKDWAQAQQTKSQLALLTGVVKFKGMSSLELGTMLTLEGVGKRYSGDVFISAIEHEIQGGLWSSEVEFGCSSDWFSEKENVVSPGAAGLLPAAEGLQVGIVKKLEEDPDSEVRIQVSVPVLQAKEEGVWARLAHYYASSGFGSFFIPEVGDEVILGYFNNDPSYPVILGSLYSSKNKAPLDLTADNYIKSLTTKSKLKLEFDDEKKIITLLTPGGHSIVMDDDTQKITVTDSNKNIIETSSSGISLTSKGDISLEADGKITLTAKANIELSATGDAKVEGMNVQCTAKTAYTAKGNASAEVSASGTTTIKGAMVMIN